jgi:hypothetical protein
VNSLAIDNPGDLAEAGPDAADARRDPNVTDARRDGDR